MPGPLKPRHHVAQEAMSLAECLVKHFRQDPKRAVELIALGAIYSNGERVERDAPVAPGDHLQVYLTPTRFAVEGVNWLGTIVHEEADFMVVNKPSGVPVHATVDNACDNLLYQLRAATGKELWVTQRIDAPVAGLVVLAKSADFQREFNRRLSAQALSKRYRTLTVKKVAPGKYVHYLDPEENIPRKVSKDPKPGWQRCELEVLSVQSLLLPASNLPFVEMEIRLFTGRTHQIRAQLGALGAAIVGDKLYGSTVRYSKLKYGRGIALCSAALSWDGGPKLTLAPPWSDGKPVA